MPSSMSVKRRCPYECLARPLHTGCPIMTRLQLSSVMGSGRQTQSLSSRQCMWITLRSAVASRNISGGEAMAATVVIPGKHAKSLSTSCMTRPKSPGYQFPCSLPVPATVPDERSWLSTKGSYLGVIESNDLPNSC